jgi:hypothetical protein
MEADYVPLSANAIKSSQDAPFDDDSAPDARSQNGPEHHTIASAGAICSLRDRKAVGIAFKPDRLS